MALGRFKVRIATWFEGDLDERTSFSCDKGEEDDMFRVAVAVARRWSLSGAPAVAVALIGLRRVTNDICLLSRSSGMEREEGYV